GFGGAGSWVPGAVVWGLVGCGRVACGFCLFCCCVWPGGVSCHRCAVDACGPGPWYTAERGASAPSWWAPAFGQLPSGLGELAGPARGLVDLPLHLAWSGLRTFGLDDEKLLLGMYRIVLTTGLRGDCLQFLDGGLLVAHWPRLRKMVGRGVRSAWEDSFPVLCPRSGRAAA
ncbi:hypothetical protein, partial [Streptomyces sp. SAS_260]|uniref:hypothetical protein n=1 Tax=Streptomyces sp. SAS_260 TaxID=3412751 RepID=UPI00403CEFC8